MADPRFPATELGAIRDLLKDMLRRLDELEKPTGTQLSKAVEKILELFDTLETTVQTYIGLYSYTKAQIESLSWLGILPPGKGGTGTTNAANNTFTTGGPWNVIYGKTATGELGHAPSLRALKQDITDAFPDDSTVWGRGAASPPCVDPHRFLELPVQRFRYIDDVVERGDDAYWHHGFIADDVAELGLEPVVMRDSDGEVVGVALEMVPLMHHEILRSQQARIDELEARLRAVEERGV